MVSGKGKKRKEKEGQGRTRNMNYRELFQMALCVLLGIVLAALAIYMTCKMDGGYDASVVGEMVNRGIL